LKDSKLIELFRTLSARRLSRFGEFLQSPYFNKNNDCLLLFNYLQKYAPSFNHEHLSRQTILKVLPGNKPQDEKTLACWMLASSAPAYEVEVNIMTEAAMAARDVPSLKNMTLILLVTENALATTAKSFLYHILFVTFCQVPRKGAGWVG
jgi:hypothetical protein